MGRGMFRLVRRLRHLITFLVVFIFVHDNYWRRPCFSCTNNVVKIVWDHPKRLANLDRHGMDFADLTIEFFEDAVVYPSYSGRVVAVGRLGSQVIAAVVFKPLGAEALSVISMRPASQKERKLL